MNKLKIQLKQWLIGALVLGVMIVSLPLLNNWNPQHSSHSDKFYSESYRYLLYEPSAYLSEPELQFVGSISALRPYDLAPINLSQQG